MKKYENKYFSVLGDSISTFEGYSVPETAAYYDSMHKMYSGVTRYSDTWWAQAIAHFGGELLVNNSFSGSTVTRRKEYKIESYACSDERTAALHRDGLSPDVIMVFMGMNDWGYGTVPAPQEAAQALDVSVFLTAYACMLKKLQKNYPQAEIWCFTLPLALWYEGEDYPYSIGGVHIEEYCDVICACAEKFGCRTVDLYRHAAPYSAIDDFHPDREGMKTLADAVIAQIED